MAHSVISSRRKLPLAWISVSHPYQSGPKRNELSLHYACAHVTTSYAIAHCVANALIHGSKTIARYAVCEAVGLVDI